MRKLVADDRLRLDSPASLQAPRLGRTTPFERRYAQKRRSVGRAHAVHHNVTLELPIQTLEAFESGSDRDTFRAAAQRAWSFPVLERALGELDAQPYDAQLRDLVKTLQVGY
ncbi:MAG: hypothetical protein RMK74_17315, partial [Myxococcales bacterium]|nr:hypothetical protein [Myxococcales bacterium]